MHDIYNNSAAYFRGQPAWHNLGFNNTEGLPLEVTPILRNIRMDAEYFTVPFTSTIETEDGPVTFQVPDKHLSIRKNRDTGELTYLGVVGTTYHQHTPEALDDTNRKMLDEGIPPETLGFLGDRGQRMFITYKLPATITVGGNDVSNMYLFTSTAFDGSAATRFRTTAIRVVCANTWALAEQTATARASVRHSGVLQGKVQSIREQLDMAFEHAGALQEMADSLVKVSMRRSDVDEFLAQLFPVAPEASSTRSETIAVKKRDKVIELLDSPTNVAHRTNAWGVFNAVTEWADHEARAKSTNARALRILDGDSEPIKAKALDLLLV